MFLRVMDDFASSELAWIEGKQELPTWKQVSQKPKPVEP